MLMGGDGSGEEGNYKLYFVKVKWSSQYYSDVTQLYLIIDHFSNLSKVA